MELMGMPFLALVSKKDQAAAVEGIRKIGVGCITKESRAEFAALQKEIVLVLVKMKEICDTLHEINPKPD